jgi:hypothetical protein
MVLPVATLSMTPIGIDWIEVPPADAIDSLKAAGFQISLWPYPHTWPYVLNVTGQSPFRDKTQRIATGTVIKPIGARAVGKVVNDDRADWREAWALFPGSVAYIWHAGTKAGIVQDSLAAKSRRSS